jgi:CSLREA domain-containing protein
MGRNLGVNRLALCSIALVVAASLAFTGGASAATIVVTTPTDAENGSFDDVGCTLRDAVQSANLNTSIVNGCNGDNAGADTIVLQSGLTYNLKLHAVDDTNAKGDLDITGPVTIRSSGPGLATIDANSNTFPGPPIGADRAIDVRPSAGSVTLEGLRIQDGLQQNGAAVGGGGGGILNEADLTIRGSEVVGNKTEGTQLNLGGGIYSRGALAHLTVVGSTIAENKAIGAGLNPTEADGAGIASYESAKTLTMINSTVSGNIAAGGGSGATGSVGGVFAGDYLDYAVTILRNVTIVDNHSDLQIGGIELQAGEISGSLIAGNTEPAPIQSPDCYGGAVSGGGNLLGNSGEFEDDCGFDAPTDLVGTFAAPINPNLGLLLDNGGLTRTHVPNSGSPAVNRGGPCEATDQRGLFRSAAAPCDSGAVEVGATVSPPPPPPPPATPSAPVATVLPVATPLQPATTGKRARALAKCKSKKAKRARNKCRAKARKLPL